MKAPFQITLIGAIAGMMAFSAPVAGQIPVTQSGVVEGRVFAKDGKPVAGARVGIMVIPEANAAEGAGALLSLSQTDDDGRYRLENVPPGNYFLVAGPVDVPVYFPGVRKAAEAVPVVVSGSAVVRDRDFHLTSPLTLRLQGRVVGEGKNGVTHVMLLSRTVGPSSPPPPPVVITPDGTFEFPRVQPGRYEVRVMPVKDLAAVTVVLDESDINDLQLAVPRSAISDMPITIKVAIAGDGPAPRFALQFQTSDMRNVRTMLVGLPESTSRIPLGEYSVKTMPQGVSALPFGYSIKSMMSSDGKDLRNQPLVVGLDSRAEISIALEASPAAWIRVNGRVTGLAEVAPPHEVATIQLLGTSVAFPITATVNPDGSFEIPKVLPGTYEVRLTPAADPYPRALVVGSRDLTNVEIPVKLGAFKVEGRVADLKELLQEGVLTLNKRLTVTLMPEPAGPHISGRVANDGGFFMSQVPAGTYRISIGICEFDDCISTGGIAINVVDRDLAGLAVPSGRSRAGTPTSPPRPAAPTQAELMTMAMVGLPTNTGNITLAGVVVMPDASPVPQFRLRFTAGAVTRTIVVGGSSFTAELPAGEYSVSIANLPEGYAVRSIIYGASDLLREPLRVAPTATAPQNMPRITVNLAVR